MKEFEKDIKTVIESIKFRSLQNKSQKNLKEDLKLIQSKKKLTCLYHKGLTEKQENL